MTKSGGHMVHVEELHRLQDHGLRCKQERHS